MNEENNSIVMYRTEDGKTAVRVRIESESVWLDAHQMAALFQVDRSGVVRHINNIYRSKELARNATCAKIAQVAADGKTRLMDIFNLDMIISIGYRVNSKRGGNKRIAAFLFLWFLEENGVLYKKDGSRRLSENALVALTLMIAESQPKDRETILKVIVNLINMRN